MKNFKSLKNLALGGLAVLLAAGCVKESGEGTYTPIAALAVHNVSPDAPKLGFKIGSNNLYTDSSQYGKLNGYLNISPGSRELAAYQQAEKKAVNNFDFKDGVLYSGWLTGRWSAPELVILEDKLTRPAEGKAHIRFVNMSVDAPALDLLTSTGTPIITNKSYKENSDFIPIGAGQNYSFIIRQSGTNNEKVVLPSVKVLNGGIYTIVAHGFYNGTGATGISGGVILNNAN